MERLVFILIAVQVICVAVFIAGLAIGHSALNTGNAWQGAVAVIMIAVSGLTLLRSAGAWAL